MYRAIPWQSIKWPLFLLFAVCSWVQSRAQTAGMVEIRTVLGTMVVRLYDETPLHQENFLRLARSGYYDSLLFHRVVPGLMIQGGDPESRTADARTVLGDGGPGYDLPAEVVPGLIHRHGALAAAPIDVAGDAGRRSHGSQFYLVHGRTYSAEDLALLAGRRQFQIDYSAEDVLDYERLGGAPHLDGSYTVFGQVVSGIEVLDAIATVDCDNADRPLSEIRMFLTVLE